MVQLTSLALALGAVVPALAFPATFSDGKYIVTLKDGLDDSILTAHVADVNRRGLSRRGLHLVEKVWSKYLKAYSGDFDVATLDELAHDENVSLLERLDKHENTADTSELGP